MYDLTWFIVVVAVNATLLILLTMNVSRLRLKHRISYGDGGNKALMKAIRVHANGVEQVPIYALVILALVFLNAANAVLGVLVIAFTLSRVLHAYGMVNTVPLLRQVGAAITYLTQAVALVVLLVELVG